MKRYLISLVISGCCFGYNVSAEASPLSSEQEQHFSSVSVQISSLHSWDLVAMTDVQKQAIRDLRDFIGRIMLQDDFSGKILQVIEFCHKIDGYPRQIVMERIINGRIYTAADLPFLRDVFSRSMNFVEEKYPSNFRGWYTPSFFRKHIADSILLVTGRKNLIGLADPQLLESDPMSWLSEYSP